MTAQKDFQTIIIEMISELTGIPSGEIQLDDHLQADLSMDSVSSLELLGMLDEELGIEVELEDTQDITTVREIMELAKRHLNAA